MIKWGMIGCGDVTEIKSGPAFNKVPDSKLVAVMSRDPTKAADYASRHKVPKWYDDAADLIADEKVNAIYVATPPSSHDLYAIAAINAGKPVYIEKPMAVNAESAKKVAELAREKNIKVSIAHYRRGWPKFQKIKSLIDNKEIGEIRLVKLDYARRSLSPAELAVPKTAWRVDPTISGGGLFHDLSPHQLDLMLYFFGNPKIVSGISTNQGRIYDADDLVTANIQFANDVIFSGNWCFNTTSENYKDNCEIIGSHGSLSFSIFGNQDVHVETASGKTTLKFDEHQHVQLPMIKSVVQYFLGRGENLCSAHNGIEVMTLIDEITKKQGHLHSIPWDQLT